MSTTLPLLHGRGGSRNDVSFLSASRSWRRAVVSAGAGASCYLMKNSRWGILLELTADGRIFFTPLDCWRREFCKDGKVRRAARKDGSERGQRHSADFDEIRFTTESMFGWHVVAHGQDICVHHQEQPSANMPTAILVPDSLFLFGYDDETRVVLPRSCIKVRRQEDYKHVDSHETSSVLQACKHMSTEETYRVPEVSQAPGELEEPDTLGSLRRSYERRSGEHRERRRRMEEVFKYPAALRMRCSLLFELTHLHLEAEEGIIDAPALKSRSKSVLQSNLKWMKEAGKRSRSLSSLGDIFAEGQDSLCHAWERLTWDAKLRTIQFLLKCEDVQLSEKHAPVTALLQVLLQSGAWRRFVASETDEAAERKQPGEEEERELRGVAVCGREEMERTRRLFASLSGRQVGQMYDECERCGRPCNVAGSGICVRCLQLGGDGELGDFSAVISGPSTYLGDSRNFRRHSGFSEYLAPPSASPKRAAADKLAAVSRRREEFGRVFPPIARGEEGRVLRMAAMLAESKRKPPSDRLKFLQNVRSNELDQVLDMLQQLQDSKSSVSKLVETRDEEGNTGFMIAAVQGLRRMCRALLDFSCNVDAQNVEGNTALHLCQIKGQHSMIPFILKKGADPSIANLQGKTYNES